MPPTTSTIIRQSLQTAALSAISNTLAQAIQITRSSTHQPFDFQRLFQFALFAFLNTPHNILWQAFLEDTFPGHTVQPKVKHYERTSRSSDFTDLKEPSPLENEKGKYERKAAKEDLSKWEDDRKQWTEEVTMERRLDWKNTAIKCFLDQSVGAIVNTVIFLGGMAGLRGEGTADAMAHIRNDTMPLMVAGLKLWPLVSLLSFTVIPADKRVIFGSLVGVGWGVFLSLFAAH